MKIIPNNLSMRFYDFCKNCNKCKLKIDGVTSLSFDGVHHNIYCEHEEACKRMREVLNGSNN